MVMKFPNPKILAYIGMGDAYLLAIEYLEENDATRNIFTEVRKISRYMSHPKFRQVPGKYSDDTEMSLANAKFMLGGGLQEFEQLELVDFWMDEFRRGGARKGYSERMYEAFLRSTSASDFILTMHGDIPSTQNGACMRAPIWGVLPDPHQICWLADEQAEITHGSKEGICSSVIAALMAHFGMWTDRPWSEFPQFFKEITQEYPEFEYIFEVPWEEKRWIGADPGTKAHGAINTMHAAFHCISTNSSLRSMIEWIMRTGGDTDTVGAIVMGIASARHQNEELPTFLLNDLENTRELQRVGARLIDKFNK